MKQCNSKPIIVYTHVPESSYRELKQKQVQHLHLALLICKTQEKRS